MTKPKPTCDICGGRGKINLPVLRELTLGEIIDGGDDASEMISDTSRQFGCPQCTKHVPYRRVRALRAVTTVDFDQFGKYQNPIERKLAEQFGSYLHKEGLIKFGANNLDAPGLPTITVFAELNVVLPKDARDADIETLEVNAPTPSIPKRLTREEQERLARMGGIVPGYSTGRTRDERSEPVPWKPKVFTPEPAPKTKREKMREAADARAGIADRFGGLDFSKDDFDD